MRGNLGKLPRVRSGLRMRQYAFLQRLISAVEARLLRLNRQQEDQRFVGAVRMLPQLCVRQRSIPRPLELDDRRQPAKTGRTPVRHIRLPLPFRNLFQVGGPNAAFEVHTTRNLNTNLFLLSPEAFPLLPPTQAFSSLEPFARTANLDAGPLALRLEP